MSLSTVLNGLLVPLTYEYIFYYCYHLWELHSSKPWMKGSKLFELLHKNCDLPSPTASSCTGKLVNYTLTKQLGVLVISSFAKLSCTKTPDNFLFIFLFLLTTSTLPQVNSQG